LAVVRASASAVRSRESPANPYAAPDVHLVEVAGLPQRPRVALANAAICRQGPHLVIGWAAELPAICLRCGEKTDGALTLRIATIQPRGRADRTIDGSLCPECWGRHWRGDWQFSLGYSWLVLAMLATVYAGVSGLLAISLWWTMIFLGLALIPPPVLMWLATSNLMTMTYLGAQGDCHWLGGAKAPFLDQIPKFGAELTAFYKKNGELVIIPHSVDETEILRIRDELR
jgi:hypothetical protein